MVCHSERVVCHSEYVVCHSVQNTRELVYFDKFLGDGIMLTDEDLHRESLSDDIEEGTKNGIRSILIIPICSPLRPPSKRGEIVFPIFHQSLRIPPVYRDFIGLSGFHWYIGISPEKTPLPACGEGLGRGNTG